MICQRVLPSGLLLAFALAGCAEDRVAGPPRELPTRLAAATVSTGVNGKIAFVSDRDGNAELYTMDPDGSNQTRLTSTSADELYPTWAPDGSRLAFSLDNNEIYVMNALCPNLAPIQLTNSGGFDTHPTWSGDGSKIAFFSERDGARQIYVMNADGSGQTNVSNDVSFSDEQPRWSPDGTKIAFARSGGAFGVGEVVVMNADGSGKTNITNNPAVDAPLDWSPDGSKILFASNRDHPSYELYVMNADGTGVLRITDNGLSEYPASWSPDGTKIAFNPNLLGDLEIWVMNPDGSGQVIASNNTAQDVLPDWGPQPGAAPNDSDCDGIIDIVDTAPATPSTDFSDLLLGGATAGTILSVPANAQVVIDDVASPGGVAVTVTAIGPVVTGERVHISIVGKQGQFKLAVPGTYILTDPATSTTVAVQTAGPAEVELTLNGSPIVTSISAGSSATVTEVTNSSGVLTDVTVEAVSGPAGGVSVNSTPIPVGVTTAIGTLTAKASISGGKAKSLNFTGTFTPGPSSDGVDPLTEEVAFRFGNYTWVIPAGSFTIASDGAYAFQGTIGGVSLAVQLKRSRSGSWSIKLNATPLSGVVTPAAIGIRIGNDTGATTG